ncbi:MAG: V-type ATP synthase subunit F [Oscillospiraceae bacterium]
MRFELISDNHDTIVGMRLSGINGIIAQTPEEVKAALTRITADSEVGIILITERLCGMCPELIDDLKLHTSQPLIVAIPDRHSDGRSKDSILRYVREAIGVKI